MKKLVAVLAFAALSAGATSAFAGMPPASGVVGSLHDMNAVVGRTDDKLGRVCAFCHTPHNADMGNVAAGSLPLWNHQLGAELTWTTYKWATPLNESLDQVSGQDSMAGPSRLCMSCHDGVLAPDQHGTAVPAAGGGPLAGVRAIGLKNGVAGTAYDLTDDHPIGFSYDDALSARNGAASLSLAGELAEKNLKFASAIAPAGAVSGTYLQPDRFANGRKIEDVLFQGSIMTCATCHEVHNKDNVAPSVQNDAVTRNYFLWADENQSLICISCHVK